MIPTIVTLIAIAAAEYAARLLGGKYWLRFAPAPIPVS